MNEALIHAGVIRIVIFIFMIMMANRWSTGALKKQVRKLNGWKKTYGLFPVLLIILWWVITPSGLPDDYITLYLINIWGFTWYVIIVTLLTIYLYWRLSITITIYK